MQASFDLSIATALHHRRFIIQLQALALILAASSVLYLVAPIGGNYRSLYKF